MSKPARCRQQGLAAWALYRLCAASGRRTVMGAPGGGLSAQGIAKAVHVKNTRGSEIAVSRAGAPYSWSIHYS